MDRTPAELREVLEAQENRLMKKFQEMLEEQSAKILKSMDEMLKERFGEKGVDGQAGESKRNDANSEEESSTQDHIKEMIRAMEAAAYGEFREYEPPTFHGIPYLESVVEWKRDIEKAFYKSQCKEEWKVKFAVTRLRSKASKWWEALEEEVGSATLLEWVTWNDFVEMIKGEFSTETETQQPEMKFERKEKGIISNSKAHGKRTRERANEKGIRGKKQKSKVENGKREGRTEFMNEVVCYKCGNVGHRADKCLIGVKCFSCGEIGHYSFACPNNEVVKDKQG